ncbi:uncharacterized protein LOC62_04G006515 [Vanrija pseudolonga]|uniref:Uncharacterized protein n=1 Tax=Vanrija pseudolonga TaxID=143232 RepID=A0AAF1BJ57_9TREE|nr:hypothetical protein LOC62_04G006515 [Vanrija pseudolonga]
MLLLLLATSVLAEHHHQQQQHFITPDHSLLRTIKSTPLPTPPLPTVFGVLPSDAAPGMFPAPTSAVTASSARRRRRQRTPAGITAPPVFLGLDAVPTS